MSHLNVFEDFEDEWDDFTPSLQDQLFENLEAEANEYNVWSYGPFIKQY